MLRPTLILVLAFLALTGAGVATQMTPQKETAPCVEGGPARPIRQP